MSGVSLKDIAKECGMSVATVSKALNGREDISPATRELVRRTAEKMDYLPNSAARMLKTRRSYTIGVLLEDAAGSGLTHEYFSRVLQGFKNEAETLGYDITFLRNVNRQMGFLENCQYRGLDGAVIVNKDFDDPEVRKLLNATSFPCVTIDYVCNTRTSVESDNVRGMHTLTSYVCSEGHSRIAYIHGEGEAEVTKRRVAAFYTALEENDITIPDEYLVESKYLHSKDAAVCTKRLMELPHPPTCIMYPDDMTAFGGIEYLHSVGIRVPEDVSVTGYDGSEFSQMLLPPLTTYWQNAERMGQEAAKELIASIEHPRTSYLKRITIEGALWKGSTVRKIETS